ncbi:MAG: DUF4911 domain-containing protein [Caldimicrobium sp.]
MNQKLALHKSKNFYFQIDPSKIAFLKFILEGYDHLATLTVLDRQQGIVQISFYPTEEHWIKEILKDFEVKYLKEA